MIGRRHEDIPRKSLTDAVFLSYGSRWFCSVRGASNRTRRVTGEENMPISDVVFLVLVAAAVGFFVVLAIRSNRRES